MRLSSQIPVILLLTVLGGGVLFVCVQAGSSAATGQGPVAVVWDHEPCAHCAMHVGEPAFAAQVQTGDGRVLNFDDPGCAFQMIAADDGIDVSALYFRHMTEDRWIAAADAAFARVPHSPMGFGFGAVDRGTIGSVALGDARDAMIRRR